MREATVKVTRRPRMNRIAMVRPEGREPPIPRCVVLTDEGRSLP